MSEFERNSKSPRRLSEVLKLNPLIETSKHIRTPRDFKCRNAKSPLLGIGRYCSKSPTKLAEAYLSEIDYLCDSTKRNIRNNRAKIVSLAIKALKPNVCLDEYRDCKIELINECREFVYERRYSLKSHHQLTTDRKLERKVTKKMAGE